MFFYPPTPYRFQFFSYMYYVICKFFEFGQGQNFVIWKRVKLSQGKIFITSLEVLEKKKKLKFH